MALAADKREKSFQNKKSCNLLHKNYTFVCVLVPDHVWRFLFYIFLLSQFTKHSLSRSYTGIGCPLINVSFCMGPIHVSVLFSYRSMEIYPDYETLTFLDSRIQDVGQSPEFRMLCPITRTH
jgi:hypothetical protein